VDTGPSLLWLDLDGSERDTLGLGWFARAGLLVSVWRNWEINLHGDLHGWIEGDSRGVQAAGATALSATLACSF